MACSFRRQDHLDNDSSAYVGDLGLGVAPHLTKALAESDLVVLLGGRFGEVPSGAYRSLTVPRPTSGRLVHVHASADELNRVYEADLAIVASAPSVVDGLAGLGPLPSSDARAAFARDLRARYEAWTTPAPRDIDGVDLAAVVTHLRDGLPADAVITNGAGNYTVWVHRYHRHRRYGVQLAPTSGAMGYGIPAAIAARAVHPDRPVIAFAGDGCFMMACQELATAVQFELPIIVVVADNGMLGTIRMHQERSFPGHVSGTSLRNPDFVALARSFGCHAEQVTDEAGFPPALERALAAGVPALLHLVCDPNAITPATTLDALGGSS